MAYTRKHWRMISTYSAAHFLVDFACAFLMFRTISASPDFRLCILLYNFCAFAMQMPLGILADRLDRNFLVAIAGCVLVGAAYGFVAFPLAAVIVLGLGNALFHLGGGVDVLNISTRRSGALGVFVSPGAFGVYLGTLLGNGTALSPIVVPIALPAAAVVIFAVHRLQRGQYPKNAAFALPAGAPRRVLIVAVCLFFVVCLRSYVGLALSFPWKSPGLWAALAVCAVVFGKAAGGFLADKLGALRVGVISLGAAAPLFLIPRSAAAGLLSVLLFNMTMPITLWAMAKAFPGAKGFSFGLLTFGLFLGFLPAYSGVTFFSGAPWTFAAAAVISLALLWPGLRKAKL